MVQELLLFHAVGASAFHAEPMQILGRGSAKNLLSYSENSW